LRHAYGTYGDEWNVHSTRRGSERSFKLFSVIFKTMRFRLAFLVLLRVVTIVANGRVNHLAKRKH